MIIIKYIGIFLVFAVSVLLGYFWAKKYTERVNELKELQTALNLLETKIKYTYEPLPEIFSQMGETLTGNLGTMFQNICVYLSNYTVEESVKRALSSTELNLKEEDKQIIKNLGKTLGKTDKDGQVSQIELSLTFLNSQLKKAEQEELKNAKLYKTLGATIGMAIVIILI